MIGELVNFQLAQPLWLIALAFPLLVWFWLRRTSPKPRQSTLKRYADPALLPHLIGTTTTAPQVQRKQFFTWMLLWCLGIFAMAGPRWDYTETHLYEPATDLVILLDISRSMAVTDVRPSRLHRARQEIEDLIALNDGLRLGLIAFATVAHVVSPLTEDHDSLRKILPALQNDLVSLGGSRLTFALQRAQVLLGDDKNTQTVRHLLLISDGDFDEPGLAEAVSQLKTQGIHLHALGVGDQIGGDVPDGKGGVILDENGYPAYSTLNTGLLRKLSLQGNGIYQQASYRESDTYALLKAIVSQSNAHEESERTVKTWIERYYIPLTLVLLLLASGFRRVIYLPNTKHNA